VRNVQDVKKILGVAIVGALMLFLLLRYGRGRAEAIEPDPSASASPAVATGAVTTAQAPAVTATATAAPTPTIAAAPAGDRAACAHLAELCSTSDQKVDTASCEKQMVDARKMAGPGNVERSEQCLSDAKTCAAASGCLSGGVGMGAMGEFLKGLGGALSR